MSILFKTSSVHPILDLGCLICIFHEGNEEALSIWKQLAQINGYDSKFAKGKWKEWKKHNLSVGIKIIDSDKPSKTPKTIPTNLKLDMSLDEIIYLSGEKYDDEPSEGDCLHSEIPEEKLKSILDKDSINIECKIKKARKYNNSI